MEAADDILGLWFGPLVEGWSQPAFRRRWFRVDPAFDALLAERYGALLDRLATHGIPDDTVTVRDRFALLIACDQFSRNIHRGTARAFVLDPLARTLARELLAPSADEFAPEELQFLYLPFQHSEVLDDQELSLRLFQALHARMPVRFRERSLAMVREADNHAAIVRRFGRFPHRNVALGRSSTPEEIAWLATASTWGQHPAK
ncbi:MAG: DUF924 domain-containing protein [Pseudomonadales bacterium]|nr:DUF924 domain-containing protein [Pseudomonadales bacterium]